MDRVVRQTEGEENALRDWVLRTDNSTERLNLIMNPILNLLELDG